MPSHRPHEPVSFTISRNTSIMFDLGHTLPDSNKNRERTFGKLFARFAMKRVQSDQILDTVVSSSTDELAFSTSNFVDLSDFRPCIVYHDRHSERNCHVQCKISIKRLQSALII